VFLRKTLHMRDAIETIATPSLNVFRHFGLQALAPACALPIFICLLAEYAIAPDIQIWFVLPSIVLMFYLLFGFAYFRYRNTKNARFLIDQANAGNWSMNDQSIGSLWRNRGVVPLIRDYLVSVQELTQRTVSTTESLLDNSKKTSGNTNDLSQRAEEIATMLEETSAGLEEFTASIDRNARNCRQADTLAEASRSAADDGADQVASINKMTQETGKKSEQILGIIDLIEGFASQTNMLALNACIEAARAGTHGRGFTQVADEVRALSERSTEVSKLIRERITSASRQVRAGVQTASESTITLESVLHQVSKTQELISEVATASTEQSVGVGQIKMAVEQMASLTQQNASAVDQVARIASTLEKEAIALDQSVASLKSSLTI
jgi:methyl-accepting chemotaxis protein